MKIIPEVTRDTRQGPSDWFTGTVWLDPVTKGAAPSRLKVTRVSFNAGSRTAWHTHPLGQALHVITGLGFVQLKGSPKQKIRAGDSVWIEPGELHWHGAAGDSMLFHLAIQEADAQGVDVVWMEHVTDEEYTS